MRVRQHVLFLSAVVALVAGAAAANANTLHVAEGGNDANSGTEAAPFATLQRAADVAIAGDLVLVGPGRYTGARFSASGTPDAPITVRGLGGAIVDRPGPLNENGDGIWIRNASFVTIDAIEVTGASRAGVAVQGEPAAPVVGVVVFECYVHGNAQWGIFSGYAQDLVVRGNEVSDTSDGHGIAVSNSADNPLVEGNVVHDNRLAGIQVNSDATLPGDGTIVNARVIGNTLFENGRGGAAAINLAAVDRSVIANNLLYANHASGIGLSNNGASDDYGSQENLIAFNTVVQPADGRYAVALRHGSRGNRLVDNILLHEGSRGSLEVDASSVVGLTSDYNVVTKTLSVLDEHMSRKMWRKRYGQDAHSILASEKRLFVAAGTHEYGLRSGSAAVDAGIPLAEVPTDILGVSRPKGGGTDIGAFERVP